MHIFFLGGQASLFKMVAATLLAEESRKCDITQFFKPLVLNHISSFCPKANEPSFHGLHGLLSTECWYYRALLYFFFVPYNYCLLQAKLRSGIWDLKCTLAEMSQRLFQKSSYFLHVRLQSLHMGVDRTICDSRLKPFHYKNFDISLNLV